GRFKEIVATNNVGAVDRFPWPFHRMAAEMHDAFDAGNDLSDLLEVREIGGDEFFVWCKIGRLSDIAHAHMRINAFQKRTQTCANDAGRAGDQDGFHQALAFAVEEDLDLSATSF